MSLSGILTLLGVYLFLPALLRALGARPPEDEPWRTLPDLSLALAMGVISTGLCFVVLAPHYLAGWPAATMDFSKVCSDVHLHRLWISEGQPWMNRSVSLLPSAVLSTRLGIVNSLLVFSVLSSVVILASVHLMARVLLGRWAGIAAALLAGAILSVAETPRLLHHYPLQTVFYVAVAACALLAMRYRFRLAILGAGLSIGVALLMDSRGVFHVAGPTIVVLIAIFRGPWRSRFAGLALLLLPVLASWIIAYAIGPHELTLEHKQWLLVEDMVREAPEQMTEPDGATQFGWDPEFKGDGYTWRRPPWLLARALVRIWRMSSAVEPSRHQAQRNDESIRANILPWFPWLALSALLSAWALRKHPLLLVSMVVLLLPPALMTWFTARMQFSIRLLCMTSWFAPIVLGCGFAGAMSIIGRIRGPDLGIGSRRLHTAILVGVLLALVSGLVPSWLGPNAEWRKSSFWEMPDVAALYRAHPTDDGGATRARDDRMREKNQGCVAGIRADMERGLPWGGWLDWPEVDAKTFEPRRPGEEKNTPH